MIFVLIILCAFLSVYLAVYGLYLVLTREKRKIAERLQVVSDISQKIEPEDVREKNGRVQLKSLLGIIGGLFFKKRVTRELEGALTKADIPLRGEEFLALWLLTAMVPGSILFLFTRQMSSALAVYIMGIIAPPLLLKHSCRKRLKKFDQQLGESLGIMSNALRAGFSFMQAMEMVSREMPDPLAKEFARSYREMNLGTSLEDSLRNLVKRVDSSDLDLLVTAVLIQRQVGGNLAEILDNISQTIQERIRIQGEIRALTAQGRITGIIIGMIPPVLALLLFFINPGYMQPLFTTPVGWAMLITGFLSEVAGIIIIRRIIAINI